MPRIARTALTTTLIALLAAACGSEAPLPEPRERTTGTPSPTVGAPSEPPDDPLLARLSVEEQAGQLVMTKLLGTSLTRAERSALRNQHLGGVILFTPNYGSGPQLRRLLADVQQVGRASNAGGVGLLVSIDQEGGAHRRLRDVPPTQSNPDLGAAGPGVARQAGLATGRALRDLGIHMNLSPVVDLAVPPRRIVASRSYGSDPARVTRVATAFVVGMEAGGVAATVKHFPGLGAATENTDIGIAYVDRSRGELAADLQPYRSTIRAEVDAVMLSHAIYRRAGWGREPASLNARIATTLLRQELGFTGVAITDSLNARGLHQASRLTTPRACAASIAAGADIALVTGSMETARLCRVQIVRAVRAGRISEQRLHEAVGRVLALKQRLGLVPD